jgi:hypothetical protein
VFERSASLNFPNNVFKLSLPLFSSKNCSKAYIEIFKVGGADGEETRHTSLSRKSNFSFEISPINPSNISDICFFLYPTLFDAVNLSVPKNLTHAALSSLFYSVITKLVSSTSNTSGSTGTGSGVEAVELLAGVVGTSSVLTGVSSTRSSASSIV